MATAKVQSVPLMRNAINTSGSVSISTSNATATWTSGQWGDFMLVTVSFQSTQAIAAGGTIQGTLTGMPSGYSPLTRGVSWNGASMQLVNITGSGELFIRVASAALSGVGSAQILMARY